MVVFKKDKVFHVRNIETGKSICGRTKIGLKSIEEFPNLDDFMKCKLCLKILNKQQQ